jgi:3-phytase
LVVQDDGNPESGVDQNFKLVDWRAVSDSLALD